MLELHGENFSPHLKVWFGNMQAETMFRLGFIIFWCSAKADTLNHEKLIVWQAKIK